MRTSVSKFRVIPSILVVFTMSNFCVAVWAKDWHELHDLKESQLTDKISELKAALKKSPNDSDLIKGIGIAYHILAAGDTEKYAESAVAFLTDAYEADRNDNETLCYLGSATTMLAKNTWNPIKKMSYVNKGAGFMDKAVRRAPDNISVRMTRAKNSRRLPSFLGRGDFALEDFEHLALLVEQNPNVSPSVKKEIYTNLAELYDKKKNRSLAEKYQQLAQMQ